MEPNKALTNRIAICYPTASLSFQLARWSRSKRQCMIESCFARKVVDIRRSVQGADFVLVDATGDYAQAIDAYAQAALQVGPKRVAVYSEEMHEGLEQFVRPRGSWVLFGPLGTDDWDALFAPHIAGDENQAMPDRAGWRRKAA